MNVTATMPDARSSTPRLATEEPDGDACRQDHCDHDPCNSGINGWPNAKNIRTTCSTTVRLHIQVVNRFRCGELWFILMVAPTAFDHLHFELLDELRDDARRNTLRDALSQRPEHPGQGQLTMDRDIRLGSPPVSSATIESRASP